MLEHKLCFEKLRKKFTKSFSMLEQKAIDNSMIYKTPFSFNLTELIKEELNNIDQYFRDLLYIYNAQDISSIVFYDFYHKYFSFDPSLENFNSLKLNNSNEDYIGNIIRQNLSDEVILEKNEETKNYYLEVINEKAINDGNNIENEIKAARSFQNKKIYGKKKH